MNDQNKKAYNAPTLQRFGAVADLTLTGRTNLGADSKGGSARSAASGDRDAAQGGGSG